MRSPGMATRGEPLIAEARESLSTPTWTQRSQKERKKIERQATARNKISGINILFFLIFELLYSDSKQKGVRTTVTNKIPPLNIVMWL